MNQAQKDRLLELLNHSHNGYGAYVLEELEKLETTQQPTSEWQELHRERDVAVKFAMIVLGAAGTKLENYKLHAQTEIINVCRQELNRAVEDTANEAYLQCLAVECGHGECAESIRTKFKLEKYED